MAIVRQRPMKMFRVIVAHGPYSVGAKIQPTGIYRERLVAMKYIEEIKDGDADALNLDNRMQTPAQIRAVKKKATT